MLLTNILRNYTVQLYTLYMVDTVRMNIKMMRRLIQNKIYISSKNVITYNYRISLCKKTKSHNKITELTDILIIFEGRNPYVICFSFSVKIYTPYYPFWTEDHR